MDSRLVLLLVSVCVSLVSATSKVPKCSQEDITKINQYWDKNGGFPEGVVFSTAVFHVVSGTNSPVAGDLKCKHFSFSPPKGKVRMFSLNIQEGNSHFYVAESGGLLTIKADGVNLSSYIIAFKNGMMASYRCSSDGPEVSASVLPDVTIATTTAAKATDVTALETAMKAMGFNVGSFSCK